MTTTKGKSSSNFIIVNSYFQNHYKGDELYNIVNEKDFINKIKNVTQFNLGLKYNTISNSIDYLLQKEYPNNKDLQNKLRTYLVDLMNKYYTILDEFNVFFRYKQKIYDELESLIYSAKRNKYDKEKTYYRLYKNIQERDIIGTISRELTPSKYLTIESAIDTLVDQEFKLYGDEEIKKLKPLIHSFIKSVLKP
jgi:hypothetical protein